MDHALGAGQLEREVSMRAQRLALLTCTAGVAAGAVVVRRRLGRWGAREEELAAALPGDEVVADPQSRSTHSTLGRRQVRCSPDTS